MKTTTTWLIGALITFFIWRGPLAFGYITRSLVRGVAGWHGWSGVEYELAAPATQAAGAPEATRKA